MAMPGRPLYSTAAWLPAPADHALRVFPGQGWLHACAPSGRTCGWRSAGRPPRRKGGQLGGAQDRVPAAGCRRRAGGRQPRHAALGLWLPAGEGRGGARHPCTQPRGSAARPTSAATPARQAAMRALGGGTGVDRHPPRVRFQAAVRAASPVRPGAADAGPKRPAPVTVSRAGALAAGAPAADACGRQAMAAADAAAAAQRWRLAFKRAWIQEELHALQVRARMGCPASNVFARVCFMAATCSASSDSREVLLPCVHSACVQALCVVGTVLTLISGLNMDRRMSSRLHTLGGPGAAMRLTASDVPGALPG